MVIIQIIIQLEKIFQTFLMNFLKYQQVYIFFLIFNDNLARRNLITRYSTTNNSDENNPQVIFLIFLIYFRLMNNWNLILQN